MDEKDNVRLAESLAGELMKGLLSADFMAELGKSKPEVKPEPVVRSSGSVDDIVSLLKLFDLVGTTDELYVGLIVDASGIVKLDNVSRRCVDD